LCNLIIIIIIIINYPSSIIIIIIIKNTTCKFLRSLRTAAIASPSSFKTVQCDSSVCGLSIGFGVYGLVFGRDTDLKKTLLILGRFSEK